MSTAGSIPYHLRQNKAIERNLFVDLLGRIGRYRNISEYMYVGFGGPFLEDFKLLHAQLRMTKMMSLEADKNVYARQKFNQPLSCVELSNFDSASFLNSHEFEEPSMVWFDYAEPSQIGTQVAEIQRLVSKLNPGDIFKVTLNASPATLGSTPLNSELHEFRLQTVRSRLGDYCPSSAEPGDLWTAEYPWLLMRAVESAAKRGIATSKGCIVLPLTAFVYKDGQQMLTVTAIVLSRAEEADFLSTTRIGAWPFYINGWTRPKSISVPDLSTKERLVIEGALPGNKPAEILEMLGYYVGATQQEAEELMSNFAEYYRMYPWYARVAL